MPPRLDPLPWFRRWSVIPLVLAKTKAKIIVARLLLVKPPTTSMISRMSVWLQCFNFSASLIGIAAPSFVGGGFGSKDKVITGFLWTRNQICFQWFVGGGSIWWQSSCWSVTTSLWAYAMTHSWWSRSGALTSHSSSSGCVVRSVTLEWKRLRRTARDWISFPADSPCLNPKAWMRCLTTTSR